VGFAALLLAFSQHRGALVMGLAGTVAIAVVLGAVIAMLLTVITIRLPREGRLAGWPRCVRCGRSLAAWQYLPVVGWLLQRGVARCCQRRLPWIFPLAELIYIGGFVRLAVRYGWSFELVYYAIILAALVVTGVIDWRHRMIYTVPTLAAAAFALIGARWIDGHSLVNALVGLIVAGVIFVIFYALAHFMFPGRSAPFGLGDVYLSLLLGAAFGLLQLAPMLFLGMVLAGVFALAILAVRAVGRPAPTYISYGSFLCLGAVIYLLL
jgi:leader peptidase (prepilin peptidase)/N-methyltransferase